MRCHSLEIGVDDLAPVEVPVIVHKPHHTSTEIKGEYKNNIFFIGRF